MAHLPRSFPAKISFTCLLGPAVKKCGQVRVLQHCLAASAPGCTFSSCLYTQLWQTANSGDCAISSCLLPGQEAVKPFLRVMNHSMRQAQEDLKLNVKSHQASIRGCIDGAPRSHFFGACSRGTAQEQWQLALICFVFGGPIALAVPLVQALSLGWRLVV